MKLIRTLLVLAPHVDDGEFGCGGAIAYYASQGARVIYVAFSAAEQSVLPQYPRDILRREVTEATRILGVKPDDLLVLNFEVRKFPENRQEILEEMVKLNSLYSPDMVFLPSSDDTHQDHYTISQEGFRAFKRSTMLGYEVPWNNLNFRSSCFLELNAEHLEKKISALNAYKSQSHRTYANSEFIRSLAHVRGVQIGRKYAECFDVIRLIAN